MQMPIFLHAHPCNFIPCRIRCAVGLTLVEMAVVLLIVGLILGGLITPVSTQIDQRNYAETRKNMEEIREALMGYAASHGHLPCPAISASDGREDRTGSTCTSISNSQSVGFLPWTELGVPKLDAWGHLYRYSVRLTYADLNKISLVPLANGITIQTRDNAGNLVNLSNQGIIPAAIVSMGKNGVLAFNDSGAQIPNNSATNTDEVTNASGAGVTFVSRALNLNTAATGGEIDDMVIWISPGLYLNRMISAGQLP